MPELKVVWPEKDLLALAKQISRAEDELGKTLYQAVEWAAVYVAKAAGVKTKTAPKTRRAYRHRGKRTQQRNKYGQMFTYNAATFPYYREIWVDGPEVTYKYFMKSKDDPKHRDIKRRGLAKKSWRWLIPGIKAAMGMSTPMLEVQKNKKLGTIMIILTNKLKYIQDALKVSNAGQPLLNEALGKAAEKMQRQIDRKLGYV